MDRIVLDGKVFWAFQTDADKSTSVEGDAANEKESARGGVNLLPPSSIRSSTASSSPKKLPDLEAFSVAEGNQVGAKCGGVLPPNGTTQYTDETAPRWSRSTNLQVLKGLKAELEDSLPECRTHPHCYTIDTGSV